MSSWGNGRVSRLRLALLTAVLLLSALLGAAWLRGGLGIRPDRGSVPRPLAPRPRPQAGAQAQPLSLGSFLLLPRPSARPITVLVGGVTPEYSGYHQRAPENFTGLTDSMLLAQIDTVHNRLNVLSLPRDTQVRLPELGVHKLNAAIALQGADGMVSAVEALTGLHLDAYLLIDIDGVRALTDALGGVDIYVPEAMRYSDTAAGLNIDLQPGPHHLNGVEAERFLRFRHDALGDIGRVQRQQAFMRQAARSLLSPGVLTRLPQISRVLSDNTRSNLSAAQLSAALYLALHHPTLTTHLLPGRFVTEGGISYWITDPAEVHREVQAALGTETQAASTPTHLRVALVDTGASQDALERCRKRLLRGGVQASLRPQANGGDPAHSLILSENPQAAQQVQRLLGVGSALTSGEGALGADVTVWLGRDAACGTVTNALGATTPTAPGTP